MTPYDVEREREREREKEKLFNSYVIKYVTLYRIKLYPYVNFDCIFHFCVIEIFG
jgi:hypothetical protein